MIVTEKSALSFRCCGGLGTGKVDPHNPLQRNCVGPLCMAWRESIWKEEYGYCGLARSTPEDKSE